MLIASLFWRAHLGARNHVSLPTAVPVCLPATWFRSHAAGLRCMVTSHSEDSIDLIGGLALLLSLKGTCYS
jgi:hypothetical protein